MSDRNPSLTLETSFHLEVYSKQCIHLIIDWFRKRNRHIDAEGLANEVLQKLGAFVGKHDAQVFSDDRIVALRQIICKQILGREIRRWKAKKRCGKSRDKATLSLENLILQVADGPLSNCPSSLEFDDWLQSLCEPLTKRERQIVEWKLEGWTLSEIASKLSLSDSTIDRFMEKIKFVIGVQLEKESVRDERRETRDERRETRDERRETRDESRESRVESRESELKMKMHDARIGQFAFILLDQALKQPTEAREGVLGYADIRHNPELFAPRCARGRDVHPRSIFRKRAYLGCNAKSASVC